MHTNATGAESKALLLKTDSTIEKTKMLLTSKNPADTAKTYKFRKQVKSVGSGITALLAAKDIKWQNKDRETVKSASKDITGLTDFAPIWVIATISISLGIGTMVGWKRIVVTIGEKIGNQHLNYAQGASSELVAAATIGLSSSFGLPVSTTHVLSSGIAGSMLASGGAGNLNSKTLKNIALAWVLTLPVAIILAFLLFLFFHLFI